MLSSQIVGDRVQFLTGTRDEHKIVPTLSKRTCKTTP